MLQNRSVKAWFAVLDLEVHEVMSLFDLLDDGDGRITYAEFMKGVMRLKGQARELDVVAISKDCQNLMRACCSVQQSCNRIEAKLGQVSQGGWSGGLLPP